MLLQIGCLFVRHIDAADDRVGAVYDVELGQSGTG